MASLIGKLSARFEYWPEENEFSCKLFTNGSKKYDKPICFATKLANHAALRPTELIAFLELMIIMHVVRCIMIRHLPSCDELDTK